MLDFFWFKRQEMSDPRTGRRKVQVNGVNLGGFSQITSAPITLLVADRPMIPSLKEQPVEHR